MVFTVIRNAQNKIQNVLNWKNSQQPWSCWQNPSSSLTLCLLPIVALSPFYLSNCKNIICYRKFHTLVSIKHMKYLKCTKKLSESAVLIFWHFSSNSFTVNYCQLKLGLFLPRSQANNPYEVRVHLHETQHQLTFEHNINVILNV